MMLFIIGTIFGTSLGIFTMCLCSASSMAEKNEN
ncbi:MAG: DUF3789 domain-containing protein [Ruminococcus sp.]|nr:DUF3789 domain-containing protein [Ruminococcus sp.]MBR6394801.1 DUF3789 domain-containing protein [Ruminococcus sp.]MCR5729048.1 DUF3789 domain-containing protein [Ruminococcus sp.]